VASNLPWLVNQMGVSNEAGPGIVPDSVKIAFAIGAFVFLASILITVFTTDEYPPEDMARFRDESAKGSLVSDILQHIRHMPPQMLKIGLVQFFSWFAFFTMWSMATPALTEHVFKAPAPDPAAFDMAVAVQAQAFQSANAAFQNAADQATLGRFVAETRHILRRVFVSGEHGNQYAGEEYKGADGKCDLDRIRHNAGPGFV